MDEVLHDRPARLKRAGLGRRGGFARRVVPVMVSILCSVPLAAVNSSSASETPQVPPTSSAPVPAVQQILAPVAAVAAAEKVLILGSTVVGGLSSIEATEAVAKGFSVDLVDAATWGAMTLAEFKSYRAIVLGDPNSGVLPAAAVANKLVWGAAIDGNAIVVGSDPAGHPSSGGTAFIKGAIDYVLAKPGKTSLFVALSEAYNGAVTGTPVPLLDGVYGGGFQTVGASCNDNAHIVAVHPALAGITDATLSNWTCSIHEGFTAFPGNFQVLAIAKDLLNTFTASDGTQGLPYILAAGDVKSFPLSVDPTSATTPVGQQQTLTAQLLDGSTSQPVPGAKIGFIVTAGPNVGVVGVCGTVNCLTNTSGKVAWNYQSNGTAGIDTVAVFYDINGNGVANTGEPKTTAGIKWAVPIGPSVPLPQAKGIPTQSSSDKNRPTTRTVSDPVNSGTGGFNHLATDLSLTSRGVPFVLERTYDSVAPIDAVFGGGWGSGLSERVIPDAGGAVKWNSGTGTELLFTADGAGGFVSPPAVVGQMRTRVGGGWDFVGHDLFTSRFDATGRLIQQLDRSGQGLTFAYAADGTLATVTDAGGQVVTFTFGKNGPSAGLMIRALTADGRSVRYDYTSIGGKSRLTGFTDARLLVTSYAYDAGGRLVSETNPLGQLQFTNVYDVKGRVVSQTDPTGAVSTLVWNDVNQTMTMTDATGAVTFHDYADYVLGTTQTPAGTATIEWDARLNPSAFTGEDGNKWSATYDGKGNMLNRTGPTGLVETWTYDAQNNPLTFTDTTGVITTFTYDTQGRVLTETVAGVVRSYTWNADGTLATATDPQGKITTYTYDSAGRIASQTTPLGAVTKWEYDTAGLLARMIPPRGNVPGASVVAFATVYRYDKAGNMTNEQGPGVNNTLVYDTAGRLTSQTAGDGGVTRFVYNAAGEVLTSAAPDGGVTTYTYSNRGERLSQVDAVGAKTTYTYDGAGRMISMVEPLGNAAGGTPANFTWTYTYDGVGRKKTDTDPLGRVTTYTYDALGRQIGVTRPSGSTTTTFDSVLQERKVTTTDQIGRTTISELDPLQRLVKTTDTRGFATTMSYDASGNRLSETAPDGALTTWTYDAENRVSTMVDPRGNTPPNLAAAFTTTYTYDIEGHQTSVKDAIGRITQTTFDVAGRADSVTEPGGRVTNYGYDPVGRMNQVKQTGLGATNYAFDTAGNLRSRTDAKLRITKYDFDLAHRLVRQTDPLGRFFQYGYDANGQKTQIVDAVANAAANPALGTTSFSYDRLGRLNSNTFSDGTPAIGYLYDTAGRRASMTDGTGTTTYGYDAANRVVSKTLPSGTVMTYAHDAGDNVTATTDGSGGGSTRTFDPVGRLNTVTDLAGNVATYTYDKTGNLVLTNLPGGVTQARTVNPVGEITGLVNANATGLIRSYNYGRDGAGNPISSQVSGPAGVIPLESQVFSYDSSYRLRSSCWSTSPCTNTNETAWTYDAVGNRLTEKNGTSPVTNYTYDSVDQLTQTVTGTVFTSFGYNANGDQVQNGLATTTFNAAHQTVSQSSPQGSVVYAYDGDGNRVRSIATPTGGPAKTTRFDWDTITSSLANVVAERDPAGVVQRRYTYGNGPLSTQTPATSSFYLTDPLGTVTHLTGTNGSVQAEYTTTPWGINNKTVNNDPAVESNPIRFTGQYTDPTTGLIHLRARNYNPTLGTFTQTDPMPMGPGSAFESSYVYGGDNPVLFIDPSGERSQVASEIGPMPGPRLPGESSEACAARRSKDPRTTGVYNVSAACGFGTPASYVSPPCSDCYNFSYHHNYKIGRGDRSDVSAMMSALVADPNVFFPFTVHGSMAVGQTLKLEAVNDSLGIAGGQKYGEVVVAGVGSNWWSFNTLPGHIQGSPANITFQISETGGSIYLDVNGISRLSKLRSMPPASWFDTFESRIMWSNMSVNMQAFLSKRKGR